MSDCGPVRLTSGFRARTCTSGLRARIQRAHVRQAVRAVERVPQLRDLDILRVQTVRSASLLCFEEPAGIPEAGISEAGISGSCYPRSTSSISLRGRKV